MTQEKRKFRLKGHESFILREGWLTKGLFAVRDNGKVFTENYGADELGVGTNMAKAIRYWMRCAGLLEEKGKGQVELTSLGTYLLEKDAYFEDIFSLWLVHSNIVCNFEQATSWYSFFNIYDQEEFRRKGLEEELTGILQGVTGEDTLSERSIQDDCEAILQMYGRGHSHGVDPEEKKNSPFYRLGLLRERDGSYRREQPDLKSVDCRLVLYVMQDVLEKGQGYLQASVDKLLRGEKSPGRIFQLRRYFLMQYLEELEQRGFISLNRTAGLDMVYQIRTVTKEEILQDYYNLGGH